PRTLPPLDYTRIPRPSASIFERRSQLATDYYPELVEALRTAGRQTAVDLQAAIVRLGPKAKSATPALNKLLKQEEPAKSNALNALGALGPLATDSLPAIVPLANDQNHHVRLAAINAIGKILSATTDKTDIVSTIQLLKKPYREHPELKMRILQIWYRSGSNAVVISDVLRESTDDPNPQVRNAAASILARLPK
ncbi:MAG: HEAT repeat domain-containing protein, partial [Pirellulaceae bacterium]|nr:HEAT repeat domain-containing protein [Pirellulaceae bacterium]